MCAALQESSPLSPDTPMSAVSTPGLKLPVMLCSSWSSP
jgi:hypothetical protein